VKRPESMAGIPSPDSGPYVGMPCHHRDYFDVQL
jgi:hypothetical protein